MIKKQLIDARNFPELAPVLMKKVAAASLVGLDIETHDDDRHEGLNTFCGYDPKTRKKTNQTKPLVFDVNRTTVCGFSVYVDGDDTAYYVNLNHADIANRVPWAAARFILEAKDANAWFIAHNAPFELAMLGNALGFEIEKIICTLQMAVTAYGPDQYDVKKFLTKDLGAMYPVVKDIMKVSTGYDASADRQFKGQLAELTTKITAKESSAAWSYNGWIGEIAYGYNLKKAVKSHFGYEMATFEKTLGNKAHMGQLTGEEVCEYGADDAYWAVRLFHHLLKMIVRDSPDAVGTFFDQENPMVHVFSDIWRRGLVIDVEAVLEYRDQERENFANLLRELKDVLRSTGGFRPEPDPRLMKWETWYQKNSAKYRKAFWDWVNSPDCENDYDQCQQVRSPVSNGWANERGLKESTGPNIVYYMQQRILFYDLLQLPLVFYAGKVQSDGECRGKLLDKARRVDAEGDEELEGWKEMAPVAVKALECLNKMASLEQRMKLYLQPYLHLVDPDTGRIHPVISSTLATRRMAMRYPNGMQLAKRGESVYVRGVYRPDGDDYLVVSRDWSAIELLIIGELSGDQEFAKVYSQIPHGDLHAGAAADILGVEVPGFSEEKFKGLRQFEDPAEFCREYDLDLSKSQRLFLDLKGDKLAPNKGYKYWRTEAGKGANFGYWYSGWLGTLAEQMGWTTEQTAEAVGRYTSRFWGAEAWRRGIIADAMRQGFVQLPDGQRRYRYEATTRWQEQMVRKFPLDPNGDHTLDFNGVMHEIVRRIHKRAHNQAVNAVVQGTCATLAKRTILRQRQAFRDRGYTDKEMRFLMPIHDELVHSVHKDFVHEFLEISQTTMNDHPDLFPTLKVDSSPAIGLTFQPWDRNKATTGQVELYEPPAEIVGKERADTRLDKAGVQDVIDYLFAERDRLAKNRLIAA